MYLNVFMGDNAIFQEQKIQEFSCNSYDDVGVFWPSYSLGESYSLIDHSYMWGEYFFLINLIILPLKMWSKRQIHNFKD
jgi:hypothetical protein